MHKPNIVKDSAFIYDIVGHCSMLGNMVYDIDKMN